MKIKSFILEKKASRELGKLKEGDILKLAGREKYFQNILFSKVGDHYEITDFFRQYAQKIDFSGILFDNVDVRGLDFTGIVGVKINPQTVYNKSLEGTKCHGVKFDGSFDNVKISNADFDECEMTIGNKKTILENCSEGIKFYGVEFYRQFDDKKMNLNSSTSTINRNLVRLSGPEEKIRRLLFIKVSDHYALSPFLSTNFIEQIDFSNISFDNVDVSNLDFTYIYGAKINPQTIYNKTLCNAKCNGVEFIGDDGNDATFDNVDIRWTDFTGSKGAKINPQTIRHKSLFGTILKDVIFIDLNENSINYVDMFRDVAVSFADFTGSTGVKINPQTIRNKELLGTNCNGVEFIGSDGDNASFDGVNVEFANFTGSIGANINPQIKTRSDFEDFDVAFFSSEKNIAKKL